MLVLFLAAAASAPTAVDAERAFASDAQRTGQWTAFRKWADPDAVMFTPQAVWVHEFLKGRKDPSQAIQWWLAQSYSSCDGRTAVNLGPWRTSNSSGGFTTVWQREKGAWRWVYDGGETSFKGAPIPKTPKVRRASCRGRAPGAPIPAPPALTALTAAQARSTHIDNGRGQSADNTLGWDWKVQPDGTRFFRAYLWNGRRYEPVINQKVTAE